MSHKNISHIPKKKKKHRLCLYSFVSDGPGSVANLYLPMPGMIEKTGNLTSAYLP
jgi:hypothetical protein